MNDEARKNKARQMRYKKSICKSLNLFQIKEVLFEILAGQKYAGAEAV